MAQIMNVEKSQFLNKNIEIYTANKVGQYSKFLDKNLFYITYLHINSAMSRTDVGTGGVNADLGPKSPIRFNKINNFPVANIPELKLDIDYSEKGYDVDLEISDITVLPGTIKPAVGDYLLIQLPQTKEFLFRVNNFNYNTIQSNDFYLMNCDLKHVGTDLISKFAGQIVEEYETIYENIGTDNKCFILKDDIPKLQTLGKFFLDMRDMYYNNFFDPETGTFVCKETGEEAWEYDKFVEQFIMNTGIYYTDNDEKTIALVNADLDSPIYRQQYQQSLWYAVENRNISYLADYMYYYRFAIMKRLSPFVMYHLNCNGVNLVINKHLIKPGSSGGFDENYIKEYFPMPLIQKLKKKHFPPERPNYSSEEDTTDNPEYIPGYEGYIPGYEGYRPDGSTPIKPDIIPSEKPSETNDNEESYETIQLNYVDDLIYRYLTNDVVDIKKEELIPYMMQINTKMYRELPIVMYILMKQYDAYFKKVEL